MQVDVNVRGAQQAATVVHRISRRLDDGRPALLGLVDLLMKAEHRRFTGGARWRKQAASTLRKDAQEGRDPRPLILTGQLMRSLTVPGAPGQKLQVSATSLKFGTSVYYAIFHQRGAAYPREHRSHKRVSRTRPQSGLRLPRRAVVGLTRSERIQLVDELTRLLLKP